MPQTLLLVTALLAASLPAAVFCAIVPITQSCAECEAAGNKPTSKGIQSPLKMETSLIGMAYLNYIYQNDLSNEHFCQAMLLMNSQVPRGTDNPYVNLFTPGMGEKLLVVLQDVQLALDYALGRSNPTEEKLDASLGNIQEALR